MKHHTILEQVSTFADGEGDRGQHQSFFDLLKQPAAREAWDHYHYIGDVIRSSDTGLAFTPNFSARLSARLAAECPHVPSLDAACTIKPTEHTPIGFSHTVCPAA
jgi:sigma-E factor negative regulatory protein RseA